MGGNIVIHPSADFGRPRPQAACLYDLVMALGRHEIDAAVIHCSRLYAGDVITELEYDLVMDNLDLERQRQSARRKIGWLCR